MPQASAKRAEIIAAARELFFVKGFHPTKVEEIAEVANIGKGTVYQYFAKKEDIFIGVFEACLQMVVDEWQAIAQNPSLTPPEKLWQIILNLDGIQESFQALHRVIISEQLLRAIVPLYDCSPLLNNISGTLAGIFEAGIEQKYFRPLPVKAAVAGFLGSIMCSFEYQSGEVFGSSLEEKKALWDVFFHGVAS